MIIKALVNFPCLVEIEVQDDLSPSAIKEAIKDHAGYVLEGSTIEPIIAELDIIE
jgi:hypothetical protein